ncbi:DoxX family membrane protein [Sphingobacterium olei]|uniref:DoxX family membrane protein n=1 Tax=Sphingobacterium olei TaxID=2571155 RepID=A0A4U0NM44_9SPHI|nr:MauE/DoxX family redox-associated membrane protein [Sphingobacterium olei]TJZ54892.1 DoxX family membrane protein [Sphingobacterium olei]
MKIFKYVICILFGAMFINAGLNKFIMYMPAPELEGELLKVSEAMASIKWLLPLVGLIEVLGGLLFIIPKTRALGAIMILPVMVGVVLQNAIYSPSTLSIAGVLFLINLYILFDERRKYKPMIEK